MPTPTTRESVAREPRLLGQLVVVIGGSAGIGLETARLARSEGADVVLTGRNPERLEQAELGLNYPAWKSGLAATPFAIGGALVASWGSRQALRRGPKLLAFGLAMVLVGLVGVWLAVGAHPGHDVGLWTALPLLIAGLGGGLVISPNLTLTLAEVPVQRAGSAGAVLQTGQRIGSAAGIAITGSVFYDQLASSHGNFASAFRHGVVSIAAFVAAALVLTLVDSFTRKS